MEPNNVKQRRNVNFIDEGDTQCLLCSHCSFKTTKLRKLNLHITSKHAVLNLICDICDFKTGKRLEMNDHLKYTHGGFTYDCKRCSIKFGSKTLFKEHTKLNHRSSQKVFTCPKCGKRVNSKARLKDHVRVKHEHMLFKCHHCEAQYSRKYVLNDHIEDCHGLDSKNFECLKCPDYFSTNNLLKRHTKKEHPELYYVFCGQCPTKFSRKRKYLLTEHEKEVHQRVKFSCIICMKTYTRQNRLQEHLDTAHEGKSLNCEHCAKIFTRKDILKSHVERFHLGRGYQCKQYTLTFTRTCRLRYHINTKHNDKYKCQYCDRNLGRSDNLKIHIRANHREIVFLKSFLDSYFPCTKCKLSFSDEVALKIHFQEFHLTPKVDQEKSKLSCEKETNVVVGTDEESSILKGEDLNIKKEEDNKIHLKTNNVQAGSKINCQPMDVNIDLIHGSDKFILKEDYDFLSDFTSDVIGNSTNSIVNDLKKEELQNSKIRRSVNTIDLIKTEDISLNIPKEDICLENGLKKEEEILTDMTTQFIRENMTVKDIIRKTKPKPSKIVIIKPMKQYLEKNKMQILANKIKVIESSLKGVDLVEFKKVVQHNNGTDSFKRILHNFILKLKHKLTKTDRNNEVINID